MYSEQTKIINKTGLHARPASDFVLEAKQHACKVFVRNMDDPAAEAVNAKSIVRILAEGMAQGTNVEVSADGEGEVEAVKALVALIDSGFGE